MICRASPFKVVLPGSAITGNKARKFFALDQQHPFPRVVASHGGAQSNAMLALAKITNARRGSFVYFTRELPKTLKQNPQGNFKQAMELGMQVMELEPEVFNSLPLINTSSKPGPLPEFVTTRIAAAVTSSVESVYWVPQGGRMVEAMEGINILAKELFDFCIENKTKKWMVVVEAGIGATAYFIHRYFETMKDISDATSLTAQVLAIPCCSDARTLCASLEDFAASSDTIRPITLPYVLEPPVKRVFGRPTREHFDLWLELSQSTSVNFDLLYAPRAWECMLHTWCNKDGAFRVRRFSSEDDASQQSFKWRDWDVLYVCSGGAEGNSSMLRRYAHSKIISEEEYKRVHFER